MPIIDHSSPVLCLVAGSVALYFFYRVAVLVLDEYTSPMNNLPGPPNPSIIFGNTQEIWNSSPMSVYESWVEKYGPVLTYRLNGGVRRLYLADVKAVNHVLMSANVYQKPETLTYTLSRMVGSGVLVVEGEKHKMQRRVMNPAFGPAQIRELTDIFLENSIELRDIWANTPSKDGTLLVEVSSWLSRMTLDIIGLAGFNYHFNAMTSDPRSNELNKAFLHVFSTNVGFSVTHALRAFFPVLRSLRTSRDNESDKSQKVLRHIAEQILNDSRTAVLAEHFGKVQKSAWQTRDLLSLLLKANMSTDLDPKQRISDEDVLSQVPTFLVTGHETTSMAMTWALFALTQEPGIQAKLRNELLAFPGDKPTMDDLNGLPYLDAVVREVLRLHSPVPSTLRVATKDDVIPLSEKIKKSNGEWVDHIEVRKGQTLFIPIITLNRLKSLWGEDAHEFKPERWARVPETAAKVPGIWGNMMTFLDGPRACIGYRFSIIEMKALLFVLIRAFEFRLAVPAEHISKRSMIIQRPVVMGDPKGVNRMPLILTPV